MKLSSFYIISLLFLLGSCSNEQLLQEEDTRQPIRFTSQCLRVDTKVPGIITDNTLPEGSVISIFSLQHPFNESLSQWWPTLFNNTFGRADSKGNILYEDTYYFPAGEQLDFFAVHPSLAELESTYSNEESISISLQTEAEKQVDLMYASLLNQSKKEPALIFNFHHLLTQITFTLIRGESTQIDLPLTKIEVIAPQSGTLNLWTGELFPQSSPLATYALTTHAWIENETQIPGYFLLFPQKASEFIFSFGTDYSHIYHIAPSDMSDEWEAGKCYQYNITINKNITDQPFADSETPVPSNPEEPAEDPTISDSSTEQPDTSQSDNDQTANDQTDSPFAPPSESSGNESTTDTLPETPSEPAENNNVADKESDDFEIQTKAGTIHLQEVTIINLTLD